MSFRIQERNDNVRDPVARGPGRWLDVSQAYRTRADAENALRFLNARGGAGRRRIVELAA